MAKANKKEIIEEEILEEKEVFEEEETKVEPEDKGIKYNKKFNDHDYILCRSVTAGGLGIIGAKTDSYYRFDQYGAECDIEYIDLVQLVRGRSDHIFLPRIIIEDKDFLAEFPNVIELYNNMYSKGDLKEILKLPADKMTREIAKLPDGVKDTLRSIAATMIANGEIDSIATARALSDIFGADFNLLSELFGDNR